MTNRNTTVQDSAGMTIDEMTALALITDSFQWATVSKLMTAEQLAAVETTRNALASATALESVKADFVNGYDETLAAEFIASLPDFAASFKSLTRSAVVKDGRGGSVKRNSKHGKVSYNKDGSAKVASLEFPLPDGSVIRIVTQQETKDDLTVASK